MNIRVVQMQVLPRQVQNNAEVILESLKRASQDQVDLLVFPELCLPGYILADFWERPAFLRECEYWTNQIVNATAEEGSPAVLFGTVLTDWSHKGEDGRVRKYNGYVVASQGKILAQGYKTLLPNYRQFEETRHFYDNRRLALERGVPVESLLKPVLIPSRTGASLKCGILVCEDSWDEDYAVKPTQILAQQGCDILINLSCSPFTVGKNERRNRLFGKAAQSTQLPVIYVNTVGIQNNGKTIFAFDGATTFYQKDGTPQMALPMYAPGEADIQWHEGRLIAKRAHSPSPALSPTGQIFEALRFAIEEFMREVKIQKVVIGASGGIDSAVAAALFGSFLKPENLLLVNMPSRFNSATTKSMARELAAQLGCLYADVSIEESVALTRKQIDGLKASSIDGKLQQTLRLSNLHFENIQARDRSSRILAAVASAFGGVFTCNANKSETAVGYSTLYGDQSGFLCALADLWKSEVYELGRYLNESVYKRSVIPEATFQIVPSAELSADQAVDEGKGDPLIYPYHDQLFKSWVQGWSPLTPEEILDWYLEGSLDQRLDLKEVSVYKLFATPALFIQDLEKYWNLFSGLAVAKRIQAPPLIAVSSRSFGFDYRESQGGIFYSSRYQKLKDQALAEQG